MAKMLLSEFLILLIWKFSLRHYREVLGSVKDFSQNGLQTLVRVKSAGNGGILKGSLQVLHVHVLLVAPLSAGHMAQPGADQYEGGVAVRETAHYTSAAADLPV